MSTIATSPVTTQSANPAAEHRPRGGGKKSAEERIRELSQERAALRAQNEDLLDRLATFDNAGIDVEEYRRLKAAEEIRKLEQQTAINQFIAKCDSVSKVQPGFDECLRRIADIPGSWLQEIAVMPNGPGFVVFLAGATQFLEYLHDLRPEAAIARLKLAGYDMHAKLPKFQEGK